VEFKSLLISMGFMVLLILCYYIYDNGQMQLLAQQEFTDKLNADVLALQTQVQEQTALNTALGKENANLTYTIVAMQLTIQNLTKAQGSFNPQNRNECLDSDGGNYTADFGIVTYRIYNPAGDFIASGKESDMCLGTKMIREFYCEELGRANFYEFSCPNKCGAGKCY
jgi:phage host-nuclease inhibitor protein Gam